MIRPTAKSPSKVDVERVPPRSSKTMTRKSTPSEESPSRSLRLPPPSHKSSKKTLRRRSCVNRSKLKLRR